MTRRLVAVCGTLVLMLMLGCGNKGPLHLPADKPAPQADSQPEQEK